MLAPGVRARVQVRQALLRLDEVQRQAQAAVEVLRPSERLSPERRLERLPRPEQREQRERLRESRLAPGS